MIKEKLTIVIDEYLNYLKHIKNASSNTISAYLNDLTEFNNFCISLNREFISEIDEKVVKKYLFKMNDLKLEKTSIRRKLSSIRSLFSYAVKNDYSENHKVKLIKNPKVKRKLPEIISINNYEQLVQKLRKLYKDTSDSKFILYLAVFELLYGCSLRVSELCGLKVTDLNLDSKNLRVFGKGSKFRVVPVGEETKKVLIEYFTIFKGKGKNDFIFTNEEKKIDRKFVYKIVHEYLGFVTDIQKRSPHILRHSSATHLMDAGASILTVKEILGHSTLSTTQIYTQTSIERLKSVYKKTHPKS